MPTNLGLLILLVVLYTYYHEIDTEPFNPFYYRQGKVKEHMGHLMASDHLHPRLRVPPKEIHFDVFI